MATEERDHTDDWIVPAERRPPSAFELQRRIEVAIGVARAAEEAAIEIGQASLEAAEQARDAAVHAERSAAASVTAAKAPAGARSATTVPAPEPAAGHEVIPGSELPAGWSPVAATNGSDPASPPGRPRRPSAQPDPFDERMVAFRRRAERVMARLQRLEAASPVS